jgi:hypothetical protein
MAKLYVIEGTKPPDDSAPEQVIKRARASAKKYMPACRNCGGSETVAAKIGNVTNRLCVICLMQGRRVVVD